MKRAFVGWNVGFLVGKLGLPDMKQINGISCLDPICRVCRVSTGEESRGEFVCANRRGGLE